MDKRIEKTWKKRWINALKMALLVGGVSIVLYTFFASNSSSHNLDIATRNIKISQAIRGEFEDSLSVRGTVRPKTTIYLDAVVGGRVEEKLVEEGQYVEQGQPLVRLSNASLQLDVISREAQISEQLNSLRNAQMQAETTRFDLRRNLMETENQIAHLERKIGQTKQLVDLGLVPQADLEELQQELKYYREGQQLALDRQEQENKIRALQLEQLKESAVKLKENLDFARANLENLVARAPRSGYLSELDIELGESKSAGAHLGQIDIPGQFKVTAALDEYYLNKVSLGMPARVRFNGRVLEAAITKIDSRVNNSEFIVEVDLPDEVNQMEAEIKRGQSLDLEIVMGGTPSDSIMIERGGFARETGGNWIFVVSQDGRTAQRREIKLGKKNKDYYQVLEGLDVGERVIVSSYSTFDKADVLTLD